MVLSEICQEKGKLEVFINTKIRRFYNLLNSGPSHFHDPIQHSFVAIGIQNRFALTRSRKFAYLSLLTKYY